MSREEYQITGEAHESTGEDGITGNPIIGLIWGGRSGISDILQWVSDIWSLKIVDIFQGSYVKSWEKLPSSEIPTRQVRLRLRDALQAKFGTEGTLEELFNFIREPIEVIQPRKTGPDKLVKKSWMQRLLEINKMWKKGAEFMLEDFKALNAPKDVISLIEEYLSDKK